MPMKGFGNKDTTIAMSKFRAQILASECHQKKTQGSLENRLIPGLKQGKCQMTLEHILGQEVKCSKNHGMCQLDDLSITINYSNKL